MRQKRFNLRRVHLFRMALAAEKNETPSLINVGVFVALTHPG